MVELTMIEVTRPVKIITTPICVDVERVRIVYVSETTEQIIIDFRGPSPYAEFMPALIPKFRLNAERGSGRQYCIDVLKIPAEYITEIDDRADIP